MNFLAYKASIRIKRGLIWKEIICKIRTVEKYRELYYYSTGNSSGEIDFIVQQDMYCIPIEDKAEIDFGRHQVCEESK